LKVSAKFYTLILVDLDLTDNQIFGIIRGVRGIEKQKQTPAAFICGIAEDSEDLEIFKTLGLNSTIYRHTPFSIMKQIVRKVT
jgi:hypothetical protein